MVPEFDQLHCLPVSRGLLTAQSSVLPMVSVVLFAASGSLKRKTVLPLTQHPFTAEPRAVRYSDLGGIEPVLADIRELVEHPLRHPEAGCHSQAVSMFHIEERLLVSWAWP